MSVREEGDLDIRCPYIEEEEECPRNTKIATRECGHYGLRTAVLEVTTRDRTAHVLKITVWEMSWEEATC